MKSYIRWPEFKAGSLVCDGAFTQHTDIPFSPGCGLTEQGYIKIDPFQKITIHG